MTTEQITEILMQTDTTVDCVSLTLSSQWIRTDRWDVNEHVHHVSFNSENKLIGTCRYMDLLFDLEWDGRIWRQVGKEYAVERKYTRDSKLNQIRYITEPIPPGEFD